MKLVVASILVFVCLSFAADLQAGERKVSFLKRSIIEFEADQPMVRISTATGTAHLVTEGKIKLSKRSQYGSYSEGLEAFLAAHPEIGVKNPAAELVELSQRSDAQIKSLTMVTYQQVYKGLNVDGCLLKATFNANYQVTLTTGTIIADLDLDVVPKISESEAIALARPSLPQDMTFDLASSKLLIYRTEMTNGRTGTNHLAYHVTFKCTQHLESHFVYVDAHNGAVLDSFCPDAHALNRTAILFGVGTVFTEGSPLPNNTQASLAVRINEVEYNAMFNVGGWDGWDLKGGNFKNTINTPTNGIEGFRCPNAAFYGGDTGAVYCPGWAQAIDVIGHEFGHGYVTGLVQGEGLRYSYQSGALNEAFADIMGETMQILLKEPADYPPRTVRNCTAPGENQRWVMADNLPAAELARFPNRYGLKVGLRDMYSPHCYSHPESVDDAYYYCYYGDNGGVHRNSGVLNLVYALFVDGGEFKGTTYTGIGLTKAFHIFMRGLAKHTPTATLAQNADYVTAACNELANNNVVLKNLLTGVDTTEVVKTEDCTLLGNLYDAVKMRSAVCPPPAPVAAAPVAVAPPVDTRTFEVVAGPFPSVILNVGMDTVYWQVSNLVGSETIDCEWIAGQPLINGSVELTQWASYAACDIPPISGTGTIQLRVRVESKNWMGPFDIQVIDPYSLTAYGPDYSPLEGGVTVEIEGTGFAAYTKCNPTADSDGVDCAACYFGYDAYGVPAPATVSSNTAASCVAPAWSALDTSNYTLEIWLTMNYFIAIGPIDFTYKAGVGPVGAVPLTVAPFGFSPTSAPTVSIRPPTTKAVSGASEVVGSALLALASLIVALLA